MPEQYVIHLGQLIRGDLGLFEDNLPVDAKLAVPLVNMIPMAELGKIVAIAVGILTERSPPGVGGRSPTALRRAWRSASSRCPPNGWG